MGILTLFFLILFLVEWCIFIEKRVEEILPIVLCVLIIILQVLGMFRILSYVMFPLCLLCVFFAPLIYKNSKENSDLFQFIKERVRKYIFTFGGLVIIETIVLCAVLQIGRPVGKYDEFNFWATAVKSLWHFDGFAAAKDMWAIWEYPQAMPMVWHICIWTVRRTSIIYNAFDI